MTEPIHMSLPDIDESDVAAVAEVVRSGRLALGPKSEEFERAMAEYIGVRHAVTVSSGTAGLHLVVRGLGLGPGDEVLVPSFTFAASVNVILQEGATPVFVDIEPGTWNLDPAELERRATSRTKAVMVVDVFGHPAEWDPIVDLARARGWKLMDDSCEALGAEYRGTKIGRFGEAAVFAFYPNKQMTTGEGGIIVTDDDALADLARSLRNQGRGKMGTWLEHERLGYNYRMNEMSAALGASQLARFETLLARRTAVAAAYTRRLTGVPGVHTPVVRDWVRMSWFVYVVALDEGIERGPVMRAMEARGIPVRAYFSPIHEQPYIRQRFGLHSAPLPVTASAARRTVALPFHNRLTEAQIDRVATALEESLDEVRRGA